MRARNCFMIHLQLKYGTWMLLSIHFQQLLVLPHLLFIPVLPTKMPSLLTQSSPPNTTARTYPLTSDGVKFKRGLLSEGFQRKNQTKNCHRLKNLRTKDRTENKDRVRVARGAVWPLLCILVFRQCWE